MKKNRRPLSNKQKILQRPKYYAHFRDRLIERYGLDISYKEWLALKHEEIPSVIRMSGGMLVGFMEIKGIEVLVCKEQYAHGLLRTALPRHEANRSDGQNKKLHDAA